MFVQQFQLRGCPGKIDYQPLCKRESLDELAEAIRYLLRPAFSPRPNPRGPSPMHILVTTSQIDPQIVISRKSITVQYNLSSLSPRQAKTRTLAKPITRMKDFWSVLRPSVCQSQSSAELSSEAAFSWRNAVHKTEKASSDKNAAVVSWTRSMLKYKSTISRRRIKPWPRQCLVRLDLYEGFQPPVLTLCDMLDHSKLIRERRQLRTRPAPLSKAAVYIESDGQNASSRSRTSRKRSSSRSMESAQKVERKHARRGRSKRTVRKVPLMSLAPKQSTRGTQSTRRKSPAPAAIHSSDPCYINMERPKAYLFLHNIAKKNNFGTILRSAAAFNFDTVFYVSSRPDSKKQRVLDSFSFHGNKGTLSKMQFVAFPSVTAAKVYFRENNLTVCGVQIDPNAEPIQKAKFRGDTVFFMGNEGTGIAQVHKQLCDHYVYIPQYSTKTASLNVSVAAGIVFHSFALWAGYEEAPREGQKFKGKAECEVEGEGEVECLAQIDAECAIQEGKGL